MCLIPQYDPNTQTVTGSKNTGNIARQTISFDGLSEDFVQTYQYDSLYRLKEANEKAGTTENWKQNFTYDRYGNRLTHDKFINGNPITHNNQTHPTIDPNTNRFNAGQDYSYDKVGNLISDADNRSFTFDGNNKQILVTNLNSQSVGEYFYDGNGKRVKKKSYVGGVLDETVIFVYSGGKLVEEFSTKAPPTEPQTKYVATDHLQSIRALSNQDGEIVSRRDFMPFGEELQADTSYRQSNLKYNSDDVRQKFTGYEKDEETGLDYAQARMYQNQHARFTAVDPLLASGKSGNPQTFNRYVYVVNSPLQFTDPTGLQVDSCTDCTPHINPETGQFWNKKPEGEGAEGAIPYDGRWGDTVSGQKGEYLIGKTYITRIHPNQTAEETGMYMGCAGMTNICVLNPGALPNTLNGWKNGALDFGKLTLNAPLEMPMFAIASPFADTSIGNMIDYPRFFDYAPEPSSLAEKQAYYQSLGIFTVSSFAIGGGQTSAGRFFGNTKFFTVQSADDIARLKMGGNPFPQAANRSALGDGVYAFDNSESAQKYLNILLQRGNSGSSSLRIHEFSISNYKLDRFRSLNIDNLNNPRAWMNNNSRLWGGTPNHGLQYIQRGTNFGTEHFFNRNVFNTLRW